MIASFLAEGSKFLFFDTAICHKSLWYPPGDDSLPRPAESCTLGDAGIFTVASTAVFLVSLLIVCIRSPKYRQLDSNYGPEINNNDDDENVGGSRQYSHDGSYHEPTSDDYMDTASEHDHFEVVRHVRSDDVGSQFTSTSRGLDSEYDSGLEDALSNSIRGAYDDDDEILSHRMDSLDRTGDRELNVNEIDDGDSTYHPQSHVSSGMILSNIVRPRISESRLSTIEKMQMKNARESESELIIDQLINELNESFRFDGGQKSHNDSNNHQLSITSPGGGSLTIDGNTADSNYFQRVVPCGNDESDQRLR
jgi:hypothetical protein